MGVNEQYIRDLERVETVAEADFATDGEPGFLNVRIRGGAASFGGCEHDYLIRAVRVLGSGDVVLNVDPLEDADTGVYLA